MVDKGTSGFVIAHIGTDLFYVTNDFFRVKYVEVLLPNVKNVIITVLCVKVPSERSYGPWTHLGLYLL